MLFQWDKRADERKRNMQVPGGWALNWRDFESHQGAALGNPAASSVILQKALFFCRKESHDRNTAGLPVPWYTGGQKLELIDKGVFDWFQL